MKKKVIPAIIIIVLILICAGIFAGQMWYKKYSYSNEKADLNAYFGISSETEVPILLGNEFIEERAQLWDGYYYLDFASVQKYLNNRFYYGKEDGTLLYTTPTAIITTEIGTSSWSDTTGGGAQEAYTIARLEGDTLYVALEYVKKYTNFFYQGFTEPNHMILTTSWEDQVVAKVLKDTKLRRKGGVKSEILTDLKKDDTVIILERYEEWAKVQSADGFIGCVENKRISEDTTLSPIPVTDYTEPEYTSISKDYTINMGFHMIGGEGGNDTLLDAISGTKALNVIAPTWFSVADDEGTVRSLASSSYVNQAHDRGLEVWAAFDNFNVSRDISTSAVLSSAAKRAYMIQQVVDATLACGADGINLDFEEIKPEDGQSFVEFVREMAIACRAKGLVFSIDNYVPMNFNSYYNIKEQGIVADYVVIMGYDEHYAGSQEAGSVASIGYVENGIINATNDVDPAKVINAVPFYTRIWETGTDGKVTCQTVTMPKVQEYIANHNMTMNWESEVGQYYGEYAKSDGTLVQIWLEDTESLKQKITSMQLHQIAGIAEWCLGQESSDVWDVIAEYVNG
jgi:spore germination protein YaaH